MKQTTTETAYSETPVHLSLEDFEARVSSGDRVLAAVEALTEVRVEVASPLVCTAIHDGHALREGLVERCALSHAERRYEEDPFTGALIRAMPITVVALDSRYEYDLNRPRSQCVYSEAWGKHVWKAKLPFGERRRSQEKHRRFFDILESLLREVEDRFGACIVFDVHSYNHRRISGEAPTFNLGTSQIDLQRFENIVHRLEGNLGKIVLPNLDVTIARDRVFEGRGYLAAHVNGRFHNTLVIPLEIAKVFMDEDSGEHYPMLIEELRRQLKHAFMDTAAFFSRKHARRSFAKPQLLPSRIGPVVLEVDRMLYRQARGIDTLKYVNPVNIVSEKRRFLARRGESPPTFRYSQLGLDPYRFREGLYKLPIRKIRDPDIQAMYREVVDRLAVRIELLTTLGTDEFIYNSLRYYGEPDERDLANARFLLHAPDMPAPAAEQDMSSSEARDFFVKRAKEWNLPVRVMLSDRIAAKAMMASQRNVMLVSKGTMFSRVDLEALCHHELGIHLVTTLNARAQPLRIFSLGLPGNTEAQEGLAVLCEYLSGNLTIERLRTLAYRVIVVYEMVRRNDFSYTFNLLRTQYGLNSDTSFDLCLRAYRGGGYTKDFLYLRGLRGALEVLSTGKIETLLTGKVGFAYIDRILEMQQRSILTPLAFRSPALDAPSATDPLIDYLLSGIR